MAHIVRRSHARIPCDRRIIVFHGATLGRRIGEGRLLDCSLSGAYIRLEPALDRGVPYRLHIESPDGTADLPFRVAREGPKNMGQRHYGIVFNLTADQEKKLSLLLDHLRRLPPPVSETPFDRSMKKYWEL